MNYAKHLTFAILLSLVGFMLPANPIQADEPQRPPPHTDASPIVQDEQACKSRWRFVLDGCAGNFVSAPPETPSETVTESNFLTPIGSPDEIKGLYITYNALSLPKHRSYVENLLETTELNALVIDIKGDNGYLAYPSQVALAQEIGADRRPTLPDWPSWRQWFAERDIYTIARIVVFKDDVLASAHPEWAVQNAETGEVWRDNHGIAWIDPTQSAAWDYPIALAVEAAQMGFDEIQLDYIRFPADVRYSNLSFNQEAIYENRVGAISGFVAKTNEALAPYNVKLSVDVFGYATWRTDDMGIGQNLESIAPYIDVISPMVYPSTFGRGLPEHPEYKQAIAFPYEVVNKSVYNTVSRLQDINPQLEVRPWLQDFPDYAFDGRTYTPEEIRLQMAGSADGGGKGWLLWDPRIIYTPEALLAQGE